MTASWEDLMREGAHTLVYGHRARLENLIIRQMRDMQDKKILPTWENYVKTDHWRIVQRYLKLEEQFMFRCVYKLIFKATWPGPTP